MATERTTCVVAGGGPAGMVLGLLLARAGVRVTVLEKHADFLRDFRGDTVHTSTLGLLDELGLADAFERLPYSRVEHFQFPGPDGKPVTLSDFTHCRASTRTSRWSRSRICWKCSPRQAEPSRRSTCG